MLALQFDLAAAFDMAIVWSNLNDVTNELVQPHRRFECQMFVDTGVVAPEIDLILPAQKVKELGLKPTGQEIYVGVYGGGTAVLHKYQPVRVPSHPEVKLSYLDVWATKEATKPSPEVKEEDGIVVLESLMCAEKCSSALIGKHGLAKLAYS